MASCKKLIEIPPNPPSAITQQVEFSDSTSTMTAVAGVYAYIPGTGFGYSDGNLTICTGLSSDEISSTINDDRQQFYSYTLTSLNSQIGTLWSNPYQAIFLVNSVLNGVANNGNLSDSFKQQVTGEMEVVRSLYYFNMVNEFGGLPLVITTDYKATSHLPRSAVSAIYNQIISDLGDAQKKLKTANPSNGRARPNIYSATALLSKVNLYLGNWQKAYNEADSVIKSGSYNLELDLNNVFLEGSAEAIWQIPANQGYYATSDGKNFVPQDSGDAPKYLITSNLLSAFEPGDQRQVNWIGSTSINGQTLYYPYKYKNVTSDAPNTEDYMVLRLGEIYLIRAEAAAHLGNISQAMADVNVIRDRAGLAPASAASQTAALNIVMHERQLELFCEWGNRWFDLKRTGTAGTVLAAEKSGWTTDAALYPLPQAQIQLDNQLIQNPGYH
ncbi:RagB/SusD family nutrient uptake outer membrane protein [Mucilaginibacter kameinonensis]|uniref:RagB/SusD family nutrient uptake outer membrane protein n=1 Tax=Mucilaginibacter kameinonensis TaxID=452286 RepID=UPI001FC9BB59|nr:RagB/SusD family nutrient uptake outer membrane protein [Mucilaginibacter kameinonensis]